MKKKHIISLVIIFFTALCMIITGKNASTYVTFKEAKKMQPKKLHIIGKLHQASFDINTKSEADTILYTEFLMKDQEETIEKVHYNAPLPKDLQFADQIVVIGHYQTQCFFADQILLKCPSKYNPTTIPAPA